MAAKNRLPVLASVRLADLIMVFGRPGIFLQQ